MALVICLDINDTHSGNTVRQTLIKNMESTHEAQNTIIFLPEKTRANLRGIEFFLDLTRESKK